MENVELSTVFLFYIALSEENAAKFQLYILK